MPAPSSFGSWVCGVAYAGTGFSGWQTQPATRDGARAIQDVLEAALSQVAGERVKTRCAGRTDAGVHALNQVVRFETAAHRPASAWTHGTRTELPSSIRIRWALAAPVGFDPRFDARERTYHYVFSDAPVASPLWLGRCGHSRRPLDLGRLESASRHLLGTHDFSAFRSSECQARSPVRTVNDIRWRREGRFVLMSISANAFLHHMVRNLVGCLAYVGDGRRDERWLRDVLAGGDRALAAPTFDAAGLYLAGVRYDPGLGLPTAAPPLELAGLE
ncbi:MAG: tRNA pseudouridine(38-40) synthase TruA [Lautropia sp.]